MKYVDRDHYTAGDTYGVGEPPKTGKMKSSYMDSDVPKKSKTKVGDKPPRKMN